MPARVHDNDAREATERILFFTGGISCLLRRGPSSAGTDGTARHARRQGGSSCPRRHLPEKR